MFEEGKFLIPELQRLKKAQPDTVVAVSTSYTTGEEQVFNITEGKVVSNMFPFVILTSNGEREFPPAFLRRCLRLNMPEPSAAHLKKVVQVYFSKNGQPIDSRTQALIEDFVNCRDEQQRNLAIDQLLNAVYLVTTDRAPTEKERKALLKFLFHSLSQM